MQDTKLMDLIKDDFPRAFYWGEDGNNYKLTATKVESFMKAYTQMRNLEFSGQLRRPIRLWREQNVPYSYVLHYTVGIPNIKYVKLYRDGVTPELLADSGTLQDTDNYEHQLMLTSDTIIPADKFYVEVADYEENIWRKGIPENDTAEDDIYDHDPVLDMFGYNWNITRRTYKSDIAVADYPYTVPAYFIDMSEADYDYENRIREIMDDYKTLPLPVVEVKKFFNITPTLEGRWRHVAYMDDAVMVEMDPNQPADPDNPEDAIHVKYMQDTEWNSAVFDINVSLNMVPKNIDMPTVPMIQSIIDRTMPLSKKGVFSLTGEADYGESHSGLYDYVQLGNASFPPETTGLTEKLNIAVSDSTNIIGYGLSDLCIMNRIILGSEGNSVNERIIAEEIAQLYYHNTDTDFGSDTLSGLLINGTGSDARVKLNDDGIITKNPGSVTDTQYNEGQIYWQNMDNIKVQDGNAATATIDGSGQYYSRLIMGVYSGFNIPGDATIDSIVVKVRRKGQYCSDRRVCLFDNAGYQLGMIGPYNEGQSNLPTDYDYITATFTTDQSGRAFTPSQVNAGLKSGYSILPFNANWYTWYPGTAYVDLITITVNYSPNNDGNLVSQTLTPSNIKSYGELSCSANIPTGCTLTFDILDNGGNIISGYGGKSAPVDLSGINPSTYPSIKFKANFHTSGTNTPEVDWIKVLYRKNYTF